MKKTTVWITTGLALVLVLVISLYNMNVGGIKTSHVQENTGSDEASSVIGSVRRTPMHIVSVRDFGAKGDGKTDDTAAIQAAINASNNVFFPRGTYVLGTILGTDTNFIYNRFLTLHSNLTLSGEGATSVLKLRDHFLDNPDDTTGNANMLVGNDVQNVSISNLYFDLNGQNNLTPAPAPGKTKRIRTSYAILVFGGSNLKIENNSFVNSAGRNVILLQRHRNTAETGWPATGASVSGNTLINGGAYVGSGIENPYNDDFSFIYVSWDNSDISNNYIKQDNLNIALKHYAGGIEVHADNQTADGNTLIGVNPAFYIANDKMPITQNIKVSGNTIRNSLRGVVFFLGKEAVLKDIEVSNNKIQLARIPSSTSGCIGIQVPNGGRTIFDPTHTNDSYVENVTIKSNTISNSFLGSPTDPSYNCIGMELHSLHAGTISQNTIKGMGNMGIYFLGSPWGSENVTINNNTITDSGSLPSVAGSNKTSIYFNVNGSATTSHSSVPIPFYVSNMEIQDNILGNSNSGGGQISGITLINIASSRLTSFYIKHNTFKNVPIVLSDGHSAINNLESLNSEAHFN
jgi:hypothetical protein